MPRGDRTGPNGAGAMSGRRQGNCNGNTIPGFHAARFFQEETAFYGRGISRGRGVGNQFGGGFGRGGFATYSKAEEKTILESHINQLKLQLTELENQFKNLEK
ncbi:MAG TPA: hypothetical protein DCG69_09845 [Bacteroidales bacterium]|nr:hypothetical protein [Bacteroidales bacterium]